MTIKKTVRRVALLSVFLGTIILLPSQAMAATMWEKAGRGINNVLFGWVEVFRQPVVMHKEEGVEWPIAVAGGALRGVGYAAARTLVGVYEFVTFPFPGARNYEPIMKPAHVIPAYSTDIVPAS